MKPGEAGEVIAFRMLKDKNASRANDARFEHEAWNIFESRQVVGRISENEVVGVGGRRAEIAKHISPDQAQVFLAEGLGSAAYESVLGRGFFD